MMSLVRLLSFTTLACGCVTGKYREIDYPFKFVPDTTA